MSVTNGQLKELLIAIDAKLSKTVQISGLVTREEINEVKKDLEGIKKILKNSSAQ